MEYAVILLVILLITPLSFTGSIKYKLNTDEIKLYATYWIPYTIKVQDIASIKIIDNIKFGMRLCGLGSFRCAAGLFRNKAYGNYIIYTDNYSGQHIEIKLNSGKIIILGTRNQDILELYNSIQRRNK